MLIFREDLEKNRWTRDLDSFSSRNNLNELEEKCNNSSCFDEVKGEKHSKIARDPLDDRAEMTERRETGGRGSYISIIKANTPLRGATFRKRSTTTRFVAPPKETFPRKAPFRSKALLLCSIAFHEYVGSGPVNGRSAHVYCIIYLSPVLR